jgi:hypothetical protein
MRSWVVQPESLLTQWETVSTSVVTFLGVMTLLAASAAILFTTAAEALVAPKLKDIVQNKVLQGLVSGHYANSVLIADSCLMPVPRNSSNPDTEDDTCLQTTLAEQAGHDLNSYLSTWMNALDTGVNTSTTACKSSDHGLLAF